MRCYNLVFNFKIFCHNYGSIITLIFFLVYVLFMIYYCSKDISPIKVSVSKLLFEEQKKDEIIKPYIFFMKTKDKKGIQNKKSKQIKNKTKKDLNPPKKGKAIKTFKPHKNKNYSFEAKSQEGDIKLIDLSEKGRNAKNKNNKEESIKSEKIENELEFNSPALMALKKRGKLNIKNSESELEIMQSNEDLTKDQKKGKNNKNQYDNYELNNMDYYEASDFDNRSCFKTYWSVLLREHYVIFTFCSRNDYNLFYVKIERFFILICTEMTMNGMFFVHETMY